MSKIVFFSDLYLPTFPHLDIPLYNYLTNQGVEVKYVLNTKDYRLHPIDHHKTQIFDIFQHIVTPVESDKKVVEMMQPDDLLIMRFGYKGPSIENTACKIRKTKSNTKILMLDPAAIDLRVRACPAQYITSKSEWMKQQVLKQFPGTYKDIFPVGTIHFDYAAVVNSERLNKKEFLRSYGLDENRKLAVLTPANPAEIGHQKGVNNEYLEIIKTVQSKCPDYNIMVKGHPMDYTAHLPDVPGIIHKNQHYGNQCSWETFAPGVKVVRPEEGYNAFKVADVVLNVRSSIAMETPFFPTPLININRSKYTTNWPDSKNPLVMKDIMLNQLADVLNNNDYGVDAEACKKYVLQYCDPEADGKAYIRTGDVAIRLLGKFDVKKI